MKIDQIMVTAVNEMISVYGIGAEVTRPEIIAVLHNKYGVAIGSIIPSDYCYNIVNVGIDLVKKPMLFEWSEGGKYRCLGENYDYNGPITHKGENVGVCINGERYINARFIKTFCPSESKSNSYK